MFSVNNRQIIICGFCALYSFVLSALSGEKFLDWGNYINYVEDSRIILEANFDSNFLVTLTNEPVWLLLNMLLSGYFESAFVVKIFVFFSAAVISYYCVYRGEKDVIGILIILFFPLVVMKFLVHIRQGVGIAFFCLMLMQRNLALKAFFLLMATLTHSSFFFIDLIYLLAQFSTVARVSKEVYFFTIVIFGISIPKLIGIFSTWGGPRQFESEFLFVSNVSGLGLTFWLGVVFLYFLQGKQFVSKYRFEIGSLLLYAALYLSMGISARILESALIFFMLAGLQLSNWREIVYKFSILIFGVLFWCTGQSSFLL